jgi:hypothetical protein
MKLRTKLAAVFGASVTTLAVFAGTANATTIPGGGGGGNYFEIRNLNSGQCLAVGAGSTANGAGVIQWTCTGGNEQEWEFTDHKVVNGKDWYHVKNLNSGLCLAVPGGNTNPGYQLMQWPCGPWNDHYWYFDGGYYDDWGEYIPTYGDIFNENNQCAAVGASSLTPGAPAVEWGCTGGNEQQWEVLPL